MSDIEARLLLRAQFGEAIKALGDVQRELKNLVEQAGAAGQGATAGLGAIDTAAKQTATAQATAAAEVTQAKAQQENKQTADAAAGVAQRKRLSAEERQAQREAREAEKKAAKEAADAKKAIDDAAEKASKEAANRARLLGPQLTDIVVGLSTGQSPFTVLLQQGGQLKDVFGGVGNAAKALASIFTPLRLILGGVATVLGTFAYQAFQAYKDTDNLNKALALTGNVAQTSAGQVDSAATRLAASAKTSAANAREALAAAASSGTYVGKTYEAAARAGVALSKLTGETAADEIKNFGDWSNGVADSAAKLNKSYHFLSLGEYERIAAMEAAGQKQEAMRELLEKLAATMEQRSVPVLTGFAAGWQKLKTDVSNFFDYLRTKNQDLGTSTAATQAAIEAQQRYIAERQAQGLDTAGAQYYLKTLQDQLAQIKANAAAQTATIDQRKRDEEVDLKNNKAYQDALAQTEQAALKKRAEEEERVLLKRRLFVDQSNARGLLSEEQFAAQTASIDADAVRLKIKQLGELQALEAKRQYTQPADQQAQQARLLDLAAQIEQQQNQLLAVEGRGRSEIDRLRLQQGRKSAEEWTKAWTDAQKQVESLGDQNAEAAARLLRDPGQRAAAEAEARIAGLKRQLADLQRDVQLRIDVTIDPEQKRLLQQQLAQLARQGEISVDEQTRAAKVDSLRRQAAEQLEALRQRQDEVTLSEQQGLLTSMEAERQKRQAREEALPPLEKILEALRAIALTDADKSAVNSLVLQIGELKAKSSELDEFARRTLSSSFSTFFEDVSTGTKKADRAVGSFFANLAKAALSLIAQNLGKQLAESLVPKGGSGGGLASMLQSAGNWFADTFTAFTLHSGGVVGMDGRRSTATLADFVRAPRYHSGGIAGLAANEIPAILEQGEEVLRADDPRHRNNFKGGGSISVGDIHVSVDTGGAGGSADSALLGQRLGEAIKRTIYTVLADESREGGMLAGARR